jgi:MSHA biogenesis protein MshJ
LKERWRKLSARFNALAPRERVLVFIAAIAGTVLVFQAIALDPLLARQKRLTQQLATARQDIKNADNLLTARETLADPDAVKRSYRDALRGQLAEIDRDMQGLQRRLVPPERMPKLLEEMLRKNRGLQLVALRTLPVQRFENPGAAPAPASGDKAAKPEAKEPERSMYQHSVEITLQGSYADLHDYLAQLERSPLQMFWGRLSLDATRYPRLQLMLTVHTLSLSKAWLIV